jgi:hypothetical protein
MALPVSKGVLSEEHIPLGSWAQLGKVACGDGNGGQNYTPVDLGSIVAAQALRVPQIEAGRIEARLQDFLHKAHAVLQDSSKQSQNAGGQELPSYADVGDTGYRHGGGGQDRPRHHTQQQDDEQGEDEASNSEEELDGRTGKRGRFSRGSREGVRADRARYTARAFERYEEDRDMSAAGGSAQGRRAGADRAGIGLGSYRPLLPAHEH